jgi:hypothetical protein
MSTTANPSIPDENALRAAMAVCRAACSTIEQLAAAADVLAGSPHADHLLVGRELRAGGCISQPVPRLHGDLIRVDQCKRRQSIPDVAASALVGVAIGAVLAIILFQTGHS